MFEYAILILALFVGFFISALITEMIEDKTKEEMENKEE